MDINLNNNYRGLNRGIKLPCVVLIYFILSSCSLFSFDSTDDIIYIYKFKGQDYSSFVPVELSEDKTKITSAPGPLPTQWPVKIANEYYLNGTMGKNSAYLSITIEQYNNGEFIPGIDSLYKVITERDPYLEFYQGDVDDFWVEEGGYYGIDTTAINALIKSNNLKTYFDRLK